LAWSDRQLLYAKFYPNGAAVWAWSGVSTTDNYTQFCHINAPRGRISWVIYRKFQDLWVASCLVNFQNLVGGGLKRLLFFGLSQMTKFVQTTFVFSCVTV